MGLGSFATCLIVSNDVRSTCYLLCLFLYFQIELYNPIENCRESHLNIYIKITSEFYLIKFSIPEEGFQILSKQTA